MAVLFVMSSLIGVVGPKAGLFCLEEGDSLIEFHLIYIQERREMCLFNDKTVQAKNLTGKYITEISKLNQLK